MSLRFYLLVAVIAFSATSSVLANVAFAQNAVNAPSVSFQAYVADLAAHRYKSAKNVVDLLRKSVHIEDDFKEKNVNGIILNQRGGFNFSGEINIDSIRIDSTGKDGLAFISFNFNRNKCVYLQQLENELGKFSGPYFWAEQRNGYAMQLAVPDGVVFRAYMNQGPALSLDCIVVFNIYVRGGYEKQP
jgi:hypothetical protein